MSDDRTCPGCGKPFTAKREWAKFCSDKCRWTHRDKERASGLRLPAEVIRGLESLAEVHGCSTSEMAARMLHQTLNPDGRPLADSEIYGG